MQFSMHLLLCVIGYFPQHIKSEFSFANYYGNHMVLQKGPKRSVIWGYADNVGRPVNVTLSGYESQVTTSVYDSRINLVVWRVLLPAVSDVSRSYNVTVVSDHGFLQLTDVLFGDVWLCSGQSNMEFPLAHVYNASEEMSEAANYPNIRVFSVAQRYSDVEEHDVTVREPWTIPKRDTDVSQFSAVCWLYGKYLYQHLRYPIGLIASTWSGAPIESWSSKGANEACMPYGLTHTRTSGDMSPPQYGPTRLWNAMIHPLLNLTIYGAIWYHGGDDHYEPDLYRCQFPAMIFDWRKRFHTGSGDQTDPNFPFGFVQLAPWRNDSTIMTGFPDIRWSQTAYFGFNPNPQMPGTFMAVTMDLPDFHSPYGSNHPRDKQEVALRLVLSGLSIAYNQSVGRFQGPRPTAYVIPKGEPVVQVFFDNSTIDVRATDGFEFCCSNNNFSLCDGHDSQWIKAPMVQHDDISVSILMVGVCQHQWIMGVRYAWRESPCLFKACSIYSVENFLPTGPFVYKGLIGRFIPLDPFRYF